MKTIKILALAAAVAAFVGTSLIAVEGAEAAIVCKARMTGQGTGMGIAGQGSALARSNALADWASKVRAKNGAQYANTALARSVKYDCRQGAILEAKCVVTAVPCADVVVKKTKKKRR
jgi:hypothetical protein